MEAEAFLRGHSLPKLVITEARAVALEVVRETFEDGAFTERAFRAAADSQGLSGRERAQAQRLAYGAVQRRATTDAAIARLSSRPPQRLDPPVLAALRLGLYELLFGDATPDHAAVDQAVESVRLAGAAHATGLVNAVLRRAARERAELVRRPARGRLDPGAGRGRPLGAALAGADVVGGARLRGRPVAARRLQRAGRGRAARQVPPSRDEAAAALRDEGVDVSPAAGELAARRSRDARPRWEDGGGGAGADRGRGADPAEPRARRRSVEVLDPQPGEHVLDLCAGPGIKTGQIARRIGRPRRGDLGRARPRAGAAEVAGQAGRLGLRNVTVVEADAAAGGIAGRLRPRSGRCALLGPRRARLAAGRPLAQDRAGDRAADRGPGPDPRPRRRGAAPRRDAGLRDLHDLPPRERGPGRGAARGLAEARLPPLAVEDLGALAPALASPHDRRCLQVRPDRDRTTGFFISRLRRDD